MRRTAMHVIFLENYLNLTNIFQPMIKIESGQQQQYESTVLVQNRTTFGQSWRQNSTNCSDSG